MNIEESKYFAEFYQWKEQNVATNANIVVICVDVEGRCIWLSIGSKEIQFLVHIYEGEKWVYDYPTVST